MSLKNLEAIISYKDIKNIQKIFFSLCHSNKQKNQTKASLDNTSLQTNLSNLKKEKLQKYLKNI
jgi:DNA gyrase/topoisomerase IV subunit B